MTRDPALDLFYIKRSESIDYHTLRSWLRFKEETGTSLAAQARNRIELALDRAHTGDQSWAIY